MRIIVFITALLLFAGCKRREKIPPGILSNDKMEEVMWDMMKADQFLTSFVIRGDTSVNQLKERTQLYQQVLALHGITRDELAKSIEYYKSKPALMKNIMDSLSITHTIAPTLPVDVADTVSAGEERIVTPLDSVTPPVEPVQPRRRNPAVPVN